jgi:hypothetical protein
MPRKSETKRPATRSTRQSGRSRSNKTQPGRQKQTEPQNQRTEETVEMEEE